MSNVTTSKWEAWIDVMPGDMPSLHVTAEVDTHSADMAILEKRMPQGINPKILLLDLKTFSGTKPETNPQQVKYTEEVHNTEVYEQVDVFYDDEVIASIKEIKVIHLT